MQTDTPPEIESLLVERLRRASVEERLGRALTLSQAVRHMAREGIARARPELSPRERDLLFVEVHYGREWADRLREFFAARKPC